MNAPADVWRNFESGGGGSSSLYPGAPTYADAPAVMADLGAQGSLGTRRIMLWEPPGSSTTVPGVMGFPALTTQGTITTRTSTLAFLWKPERRLGIVSSGSAGSVASIHCATQSLSPGIYGLGAPRGGFYWSAMIRVSDASLVSGARMFCGISFFSSSPTNTDPGAELAQLGVGQIASSGNLHVMYGGFSAQTPVDTGISVNTSTPYLIEIWSVPIPGSTSGTAIQATVRVTAGSTVYTLPIVATDTQLPHPISIGGFLSAARIWRSNNATASAVGIDVARIYCEEYL